MNEEQDLRRVPRSDDYPELFAGTERPVEQPRSRWSRVVLAAALFSLMAGGGVWYGLKFVGTTADKNAPVPVLQADPGPVKIRPEEPGGMQVPDRDKLVYDRFGGDVARPSVERLLPPPEAPLPPPVVPAAPPPPRELPVTSVPPAPPPMIPGPITTVPGGGGAAESFRVPQATTTPLPPAVVTSPSLPVAPPAVASAASGTFRVQLGAVRDEPAARAEWNRLKQRHGDVLGNLELDVERADLGERGIFFRVRGGPLAEEAAARRICDTLKTRNVGCLVVR